MQKGVTLWFTGLSGSGKSTVSRALEANLRHRNIKVEVLDGDILREEVFQGLGFSKEDRSMNVRAATYLAHMLTRNDIIVLASFISPYRMMREESRKKIGSFLEVYVHCSLEECIRRDVKGLYRKALNGEIKQFTGITDPYETPEYPDLILETDQDTVEQCTEQVVEYLIRHRYITLT